ncbi:HNH endonuclease signature motif containing protein [Phenylobacterium sp. J367]|uniref:HNH endonuclease signature motif containing protein n=1 Tax=Phenylobacterium sp. J367 TaxID=2898435 RepID=UPI0021515EB6|nr:HNH endonuclease signature motif containing protein [Phenylobacterium sp. J367]MCR5876956.1 HNH endonuclease [Phenylobacterium sp. J367]MCR5877024.1 HNH endonuclease [Phenylobacterium sp. J367]
MAREIPLTKGFVAIVGDEDFDWLNKWKWHAVVPKAGFVYARRRADCAYVLMHRLILNADLGLVVDHISGDTLDNRRSNLRLATRRQNNANKHRVWSAAGFRGVCHTPLSRVRPFKAQINSQYLGQFETAEAAARAYDKAARELYGEFASLNFPEAA